MGTKAEARFAFIQEKAEFAQRGVAGCVRGDNKASEWT